MKQKMVIKIQTRGRSKGFLLGCNLRKSGEEGEGFQTKALKKVAETVGVISVRLEGVAKVKIEVIGDGIDATKLIHCLRKIGQATILSLEKVRQEYRYHTNCMDFNLLLPSTWEKTKLTGEPVDNSSAPAIHAAYFL